MLITEKLLTEMKACRWQMAIFRKQWPKGASLTKSNLETACELKLDLDWLAERILSGASKSTYRDARELDQKAYYDAVAPARKAYSDATAAADKIYNDAVWPSSKIYDDAVDSAWKAYNDAIAPAKKAYNDAVASEFFEALKIK